MGEWQWRVARLSAPLSPLPPLPPLCVPPGAPLAQSRATRRTVNCPVSPLRLLAPRSRRTALRDGPPH
eukprot:scaffold114541_cov33-Tisochrysis_lutea.AAC.4